MIGTEHMWSSGEESLQRAGARARGSAFGIRPGCVVCGACPEFGCERCTTPVLELIDMQPHL